MIHKLLFYTTDGNAVGERCMLQVAEASEYRAPRLEVQSSGHVYVTLLPECIQLISNIHFLVGAINSYILKKRPITTTYKTFFCSFIKKYGQN